MRRLCQCFFFHIHQGAPTSVVSLRPAFRGRNDRIQITIHILYVVLWIVPKIKDIISVFLLPCVLLCHIHSVPSRVAISPVRRSHSPLSPRIPDPYENRSEQIHHVLSEIADSFTISERSPDARTRCRESTRSPSRHASSERTAKTNSHSDLKDDIGTKRGNLSPYLQSPPTKFSSQRPPVLETIPSAPPSIRSQEYRDESVERFRQSYSPRSLVQSSSSPKRFGVDTGCEDLSMNHQQYELSFPLDYSTTSPPVLALSFSLSVSLAHYSCFFSPKIPSYQLFWLLFIIFFPLFLPLSPFFFSSF